LHQAPLLPADATPAAHEFHAAVMALPTGSMQQQLLCKALLTLLKWKPRLYCRLDVANLDRLLHMPCEHALLAICHARVTCTERVLAPASMLAAVCKDVVECFKVQEGHTLAWNPQLWHAMTTGLDDYWRLPAFVKAWYLPDRKVKKHVEVSLRRRPCGMKATATGGSSFFCLFLE
jgi:hypothetical protein